MKRKLLSLVMIVMLIISTFSVPMIAGAASYIAEGTCGTNLTWTLSDEGTLTISGTGGMPSFSGVTALPWYNYLSQIKTIVVEEGVTALGTHAFRECPNLTSVSLPNTLTTIGYSMFVRCNSLKSIVIPDSVTTLNAHTFYECSALESVKLPSKIKNIGETTFFKCTKLKNVEMPDSVTTIGKNAFRGCSSLESIVLPSELTTIDIGAFSYCTKLSSITIHNKLKTVAGTAFTSSNALKTVYYEGTPTEWNNIEIRSDNAPLLSAEIVCAHNDCVAYGDCGADAKWELGFDGTLTISGTGAMKSYSSSSDVPWLDYADQITSVVVEDGITSTGNWSFYLLKKVTSVSLPEGLVTIGLHSFRGCSSLTEVKIPSTVTNISAASFSYCSRLSTVYMYNNVKTIGSNAFISSNIADVYFEGKLNEWESINVSSGNDTLLKANIHIAQEEVILEKIEITKLPVFEDGEEPDFSDIVVMGTYSDGTVAEIKDYDVTVQPTVAGYLVTVSCGDISAQAEIKPSAPYVVKVEIAQMPNKTVYYVGEEIDLTGLIVRVYMSNGKTIDISRGYNALDFDSSTPGVKKVTVGYASYTGQLEVEVIEKVIPERMEIDELPLKTTYYVGEELDLTGLAMCLVYSDGSRDGLLEEAIFEGFDSDTPGIKTITVISGEFTATFEVEVIEPEREIAYIEVAQTPDKIYYEEGEELDFSGLEVHIVYTDGSYEKTDSYSLTYEDRYVYRDQEIIVSYQDYFTFFNIYLDIIYPEPEPQPEFINLYFDEGFRYEYEYGEELDLTGLQVEYFDCWGESRFLTEEEYTVSGYDPYMTGYQTITVGFSESYATFEVCVNGEPEPPIPDFEPYINIYYYENFKTEYNYGEELDLTGLVVEYWDEWGVCIPLTEGEYSVFGFDPYIEGKQTVSVDYMGCAATFEVYVNPGVVPEPVVTGIKIVSYPEKTTYEIGEAFDMEGLKVVAVYSDGKEEDVTNFITVDFVANVAGKNTVKIFYNEFTTSYEVEVIEKPLPTEGICGENVTWSLDENGVLTIEGTGTMYDYKDGETPWYGLKDRITSVVVGENVTTIGSYSFKDCKNITSITMGENVEVVGDCSFENCENISTLTLGNNVKHIGNTSFKNCTNITIISMGENIETVGDYAFENCDGLTIITIADSIKSIGNRAFYDCDNVTHVEIGDSVESIGDYAFYGCGNVKTVVLGVSVSVVGNFAFSGCDSLEETIYEGTQEDKDKIQVGDGNDTINNTVVRDRLTIISNPSKLTYKLGEKFEKEGLKVAIVYSNGKETEVTDYTVSELDATTTGTKIIYVEYKGLITSFTVTVEEDEEIFRKVTGTVYSSDLDEPVFNAIVSFYVDDMLKAVTTTDMDGKYSVELPAAEYKVIVNSAIVDTFDMTMYPMATLYTCVVVSENGANQDFSVALPLYGDVNGDEFVDVNDVVEVKASYTDGYTSVDNEFNAEYEENWTVTGIRGTVYSPELEEYIPNALVYIYRGTSFISATLTDATGSYYFDVEPGEYTVMTYATVTDTFDMVSYQMLPAQSAVNVEDGMVNLSVNVYSPLYGDVNKDGIVDINDIVEVKASYTYNEAGVKQYKVFFETYGGSVVESQMINSGDYAIEPHEPSRPGHRFMGWYTNNAFGERYYFDTPVTEDITLYALWLYDEPSQGGSVGGGGYEEDPEWENAAVVTFEENSYAPARIMNVWGRTEAGNNISSLNKFTSWDEAEGVDRPDAEEDFGIGLIKIDSTVNPEIISGIYEGRMNPVDGLVLEGGQTYRYSVWMYLDDTTFGEEDDTAKVTVRPYFGNSIGSGVKDAYVIEEITRGQWTKLQFEFFLPADQDGKETGFRFSFKETESGNYPTVIYMDNAKIQKYIG